MYVRLLCGVISDVINRMCEKEYPSESDFLRPNLPLNFYLHAPKPLHSLHVLCMS